MSKVAVVDSDESTSVILSKGMLTLEQVEIIRMARLVLKKSRLDEGQEPPEEKYLMFLDGLLAVGTVNMYAAAPYLGEQFPELASVDVDAILVHCLLHRGQGTELAIDISRSGKDAGRDE